MEFKQLSTRYFLCLTTVNIKIATHINEAGCAVLAAIDSGLIDNGVYQNYLKMEKEKQHFVSSVMEKKKKEKQFGKIVKNYYKKDIKQKANNQTMLMFNNIVCFKCDD